ncbi:partial Arsenite methyltransferase, partial [Planctomycetaceae bacterium]
MTNTEDAIPADAITPENVIPTKVRSTRSKPTTRRREAETMQDIVQDYYGRQLQSTSDLKTSACCDASAVPEWLKPLL